MVDIKNLVRGNVIRNLGSGKTYVVINAEGPVVAITEVIVTNAMEWELITFSEQPGASENKPL